ncbi:TPA: hypothetical protein CPT95_00025 [Candidatus Gastranaerophilales bacterium HUM_15]|jgi:hypothetical protein|nr:MAG TPA: hypothetical protein CPT95_00025 [Candidatus Gastranaerophilales bacterium HUM_15]
MQIGSGFSGQTEKEKKQYIGVAFDKGFLALFPMLKDVKISLWYVSKDERKSEKSPQWRVSLDEKFIPDKSDKQETAEEEIPF